MNGGAERGASHNEFICPSRDWRREYNSRYKKHHVFLEEHNAVRAIKPILEKSEHRSDMPSSMLQIIGAEYHPADVHDKESVQPTNRFVGSHFVDGE